MATTPSEYSVTPPRLWFGIYYPQNVIWLGANMTSPDWTWPSPVADGARWDDDKNSTNFFGPTPAHLKNIRWKWNGLTWATATISSSDGWSWGCCEIKLITNSIRQLSITCCRTVIFTASKKVYKQKDTTIAGIRVGPYSAGYDPFVADFAVNAAEFLVYDRKSRILPLLESHHVA